MLEENTCIVNVLKSVPRFWHSDRILVGLSFGFFILFLTSMLVPQLWYPNTDMGIFAGVDGRYNRQAWLAQIKFADPWDLNPLNPLAGLGSQIWSHFILLNPVAWASVLPLPAPQSYGLTLIVAFAVLIAGMARWGHACGLGWPAILLGIELHAFIFWPPTIWLNSSIPLYPIVPFRFTVDAGVCFFLAGVVRAGVYETRLWRSILELALALAFAIFASPSYFVFSVPIIGAVIAAVLLLGEGGRVRRQRLFALAAVGVLAFAVGIPGYISALSAESVRQIDPHDLIIGLQRLLLSQTWKDIAAQGSLCGLMDSGFCIKKPYGLFYFTLAAGTIFSLLGRDRLQRNLGIVGALVCLGLLFISMQTPQHIFGSFTSAVAPQHFIFGAAPVVAMIGALTVPGLARAFAWGMRRGQVTESESRDHGSRRFANLVSLVSIAGLASLVGFWCVYSGFPFWRAMHTTNAASPVMLPYILESKASRNTPRDPLTLFLREKIGLEVDRTFRGVVASAISDSDGRLRLAAGQSAQNAAEDAFVPALKEQIRAAYGTEYQDDDLWRFWIPTYDEYAHTITRLIFFFNRYFLTHQGEHLTHLWLRITRPDFELMRTMGVRYYITDHALPAGFTEVMQHSSARVPGHVVRLYEIPGANRGDLSLREAVSVPLDVAAAQQFQGIRGRLDRVGLVHDPAAAGVYGPVQLERFVVIHDGYEIKARAPGAGLLLLPVQWSNCLTLDAIDGPLPSDARLLRTDLLLTGVRFTGELHARLRFRMGLLWASACRRADARESTALFGPATLGILDVPAWVK